MLYFLCVSCPLSPMLPRLLCNFTVTCATKAPVGALGLEKYLSKNCKSFTLDQLQTIKVSEQENASVSCRTIYRFFASCPTTARRQNNFCSSLRTSCMLCLFSLGLISLCHSQTKRAIENVDTDSESCANKLKITSILYVTSSLRC